MAFSVFLIFLTGVTSNSVKNSMSPKRPFFIFYFIFCLPGGVLVGRSPTSTVEKREVGCQAYTRFVLADSAILPIP